MKVFGKLLIVLAFVLSLLLAGLIYVYLNGQRGTASGEIERVTLLVPKEQIPARTLITPEMLIEIQVEINSVPSGVALRAEDLTGKYSKDVLYPSEPVRLERLMDDAKSELSLNVKPGFRAMSLKFDMASGVSELIKVGDFVDVIIFLPELKDGDNIIRPTISKMISQNLEVLAVRQNLYRENSKTEESTDYTLSFAVPVDQMEALALAEDIGDLKLALRPQEEDFLYPTDGAIWEELLLNDSSKMKDLFPTFEIEKAKTNAPPSAATANIEKYIYYTVKQGDTLRSISVQFYGNEDQYALLKSINRIVDESRVTAGLAIKVPVFKQP